MLRDAMVHCQRIRAEQFVNLKRISIGYSQRGDPLVFGVKLRIYAAHNPTILQMVANLSMPSHYRFHFPTSMETHKAVKNRFRPAIFVGHPRFTRISFNFLLSSRVRGQEGPSTFIRVFSFSLSGTCEPSYNWSSIGEQKYGRTSLLTTVEQKLDRFLSNRLRSHTGKFVSTNSSPFFVHIMGS